MERRELLVALGAGAIVSLLAPLTPAERIAVARGLHAQTRLGDALSAAERELITALADTILPRTTTPSASDVQVPAFIERLLTDWHTKVERTELLSGLNGFDARCAAARGGRFASLAPEAQAAAVADVDGKPGVKGSPEGAYASLKGMVVFAYFTSERVMKEVLKTPVIPGRFDGCIPFPVH